MNENDLARRAFAAWLKEMRLQRGWTQQQAADKAGIARQQWLRLENAESGPRSETLRKIAEAFGEDANAVYARAYQPGVRRDAVDVVSAASAPAESKEILPLAGSRVFDMQRRKERIVQMVEDRGRMVFLTLRDPASGSVERQPFEKASLTRRFQMVGGGTGFLQHDAETTRLCAEAIRLRHAYLFNPAFATETSLIDPLPHQLAAVYGVGDRPGLLTLPRLRFLLADDAGAGKTIMTGLYLREMRLRRLARRILVVAPAGLVGNWEREMRTLFRLRFRIISSDELRSENDLNDPRFDQIIISLDTLRQERILNLFNLSQPYDVAIFDEAHKLSARRNPDLTSYETERYKAAQNIADRCHHLLLLTATPHMGRDDAYWFLWRLLDAQQFATPQAVARAPQEVRRKHLLRRLKEEMVDFNDRPLFPPRVSRTIKYELSEGESALYEAVSSYVEDSYSRTTAGNRTTVGLALTVIQRRLASSTYALLRSLERRQAKFRKFLEALEAEQNDYRAPIMESDAAFLKRIDTEMLSLPHQDVRDVKTGDEETGADGKEEAEIEDERILAATPARSRAELEQDLKALDALVWQARSVFEAGQEVKFEKLYQVIEEHYKTKILIFTEHRDTLEFLRQRLERRGISDIAMIHGGMDYRERERQAEYFRSDDCRYLLATDAAGEGINLQFCWLLINYDIPWNPARLEQRMGRVHRYKQTHNVELFSLVAENTREGKVLSVLMEKLEKIQRSLSSDKVFDVIGEQLSGISLSDLLRRAVLENRADEAVEIVSRELDETLFAERFALNQKKVEVSEVRHQLTALRQGRLAAEERRMMPAYVRTFFDGAVQRLGLRTKEETPGVFHFDFDGARDYGIAGEAVQRALLSYPADLREKLTFARLEALPRGASAPKAVYLHPGEEVFDAVLDSFLARFAADAERGGVFYDPQGEEPFFFALARVAVARPLLDEENELTAESETLAEEIHGVCIPPGGTPRLLPAHELLTFIAAERPDETELAAQLSVAFDRPETDQSIEEFLLVESGLPMEARVRHELEERRGERAAQITMAFNSRAAESVQQASKLREAVLKNIPAAETKLRRLDQEIDRMESDKVMALARLDAELDYLTLAPVTLYARALVLPLPPEVAELRDQRKAERTAMTMARKYEEALGAKVEDVSKEALGYDLRSTRRDGSIRYIEVKGRSGRNMVQMTENEWRQAANHPERYFLYVVFYCDTPAPKLFTVSDPFGRLISQVNGATIRAADIEAAAVTESD